MNLQLAIELTNSSLQIRFDGIQLQVQADRPEFILLRDLNPILVDAIMRFRNSSPKEENPWGTLTVSRYSVMIGKIPLQIIVTIASGTELPRTASANRIQCVEHPEIH
jgi:hypothetical protein